MPKRILLADDDASLRALIRTTLGSDYHVAEAVDGAQTIALACSTHPDLLLIDADMPLLDGFAVSRTLRANPETREVPIVMLTGSNPAEHSQKRVAAELTGYLRKPFSPSQ